MLICGALLLFRSLLNLQHVDTGVRVDSVVTASIDSADGGVSDAERAAAFFEAAVGRVAAVPGVESASACRRTCRSGGAGGENLRVPGREGQILVGFKRVDPGYFDTLDIPVIAGRGFRHRRSRRRASASSSSTRSWRASSPSRFELTNPVGATVDARRARATTPARPRRRHRSSA